MSQITLDLSAEGMEPLKAKKPGETCELSYALLKVTSNDGKTLKADIEEVELSEEQYAEEDAPEAPAKKPSAAMEAMGAKKEM